MLRVDESTQHWWICAQALINPWLFDDIRNEKSWLPTAEERLEVYYSLVAGYRDTFGAVHKSNCCGASATAES